MFSTYTVMLDAIMLDARSVPLDNDSHIFQRLGMWYQQGPSRAPKIKEMLT